MNDVKAARAPQSGGPDPRPTLLLSANSSWNVAHFRSGLMRGLMARGYRVVVAAPEDEHSRRVTSLGAEFIPLPINSAGASVVEDARLFFHYRRLFRTVRPFAFLGFTAKPNIYGSLAAQVSRIKVINNITGLGTVFIKRSALTLVVSRLYRLALRRSSTVLFQNREDLEFFAAKGIVDRKKADLVPGDGVDLEQFTPDPPRKEPDPFRFLLVGRLLWDKGIGEFVEAARILRRRHPNVEFQILGPAGVDNRTVVSPDTISKWRSKGVVDYLGPADDVRPAIREADCVVLPSYREGLPRALLEGSAMGKPLIATDVPGCRDVVIEGETGLLCEARSGEALAKAMQRMLDLSLEARLEMGKRGRSNVEQNFSEALVVAKYLDALGRP